MSRDCKQFRVANTDEWNAVHSPHGKPTLQLAEKQPPRGTYQIWVHTCPCGARHITTGEDGSTNED